MSHKSSTIHRQPTARGSINKTLKKALCNFSKFKVRMWLDSEDHISLYCIEPLERGNAAGNLLYEYDSTTFAQYLLKRYELNVMLSKLNSDGFYISNRYVDDKLIGKLGMPDLEKLNQGYSNQFRAYGIFQEGDSTSFNNIVFSRPTKFIFFNTSSSRTPAVSASSLFNKDHPFFPSKEKALKYLMDLNLNRNWDYVYNGLMFFIPISNFFIKRISILGAKLRLSYTRGPHYSNIGIKIYYEDRYTKKIGLVQESLKEEFQLLFPPTDFDLIAHDNNNIVDRVVFHFDPRTKPETGRVRFVFTRDHIQKIIDNGENIEVEFKGYKDLNFEKDDLIETVVSFANTLGGIILVGVEDNKNIFGFRYIISTEELKKWLSNIIKDWCEPRIDFTVDDMTMDNGQKIYLIYVSMGGNRPYFKRLGRKTGIYIRVNDSDLLCNRPLFDDFMKKNGYRINSSILSDVDEY